MRQANNRVGGWASQVAIVGGLASRSLRNTLRLPSMLAPTVLFPVFLLVSFSSGYTALTRLPGFPTANFVNWYLPFVALQSGSFAGSGAGFSAARDIAGGFFDRILLSPGSRVAIIVGTVVGSVARATITVVIVTVSGFVLGARVVTSGPIAAVGSVAALIVAAWAVAAAGSLWSLGVAYRLKSERAAPLFFVVVFMALSLSTAMVPTELMASRWLARIAGANPTSALLRFARQGFVEGFSWDATWPGMVTILGAVTALGLWAWRGLVSFER